MWPPSIQDVSISVGHRCGFDLPNALSGHAVELAAFIQGAGLTVGEPES
jgi:hypothetical protein